MIAPRMLHRKTTSIFRVDSITRGAIVSFRIKHCALLTSELRLKSLALKIRAFAEFDQCIVGCPALTKSRLRMNGSPNVGVRTFGIDSYTNPGRTRGFAIPRTFQSVPDESAVVIKLVDGGRDRERVSHHHYSVSPQGSC